MRPFDDGDQRRSFTYIEDVIDLLIKVQNCDIDETFNVGNNKTSSINDVVPSLREKCRSWVEEDPENNDWTDFDGFPAASDDSSPESRCCSQGVRQNIKVP